MTCPLCDGRGIVLICYRESEDYDAAACTCPKGQRWRTTDQLTAWAALQTPKPVRIGGLEDFYSAPGLEQLRTAADLDQDVGGVPQASDWHAQKQVTT